MTLVKTFPLVQEEFSEILKYISVISIKLQKDGEFYVLPIISHDRCIINVLITTLQIKNICKPGEVVLIKSFRFGYEFIMHAKIVEIKENDILSLEYFDIKTTRNYRQFIRYDVNLKGKIQLQPSNKEFQILIKDISFDGASFQTCFENYSFDDIAKIEIEFENGNRLKLEGNIVRDTKGKVDIFGFEFFKMSDELALAYKDELRGIEKDHLLPLGMVRKYLKKTKSSNKKIAIYSNNCDFIYYFIGLIFLIGLKNYEVYSDFRYFKKASIEEKPDLVLLDVEKMNDDILCVIKYTKQKLKGTDIIVVLPYNYKEKSNTYKEELIGLNIIYKPITQSQLEERLYSLKIIDMEEV